ncbi:unnamed protein product [Symbiodinium sp. CCMP2592]|nr:unnamed protein product [Symbiodinium sp. CCMP2592]
MATASVTNDLQTPIEVKLQSGEWRVVYPQKSCDVEVCGEASMTSVEVRLRESPEVKGSCQAASGSSLRASVDFEAFSRQAKGRDRAETRELAREAKRRQEAQKRTEAMIEEAAAKKRDGEAWFVTMFLVALVAFPFTLLVVCAAIRPDSAVAAALLASATVPFLCWIGGMIGLFGLSMDEVARFQFAKYEPFVRFGLRLVGLLALLSLAAMTAQHVLQGYWWTAFIVWSAVILLGFCVVACGFPESKLDANNKGILESELKAAAGDVSNRSIRFEGSVIREHGRPCVASWPGKYEGAWEALVSQGRNGQVSAAVVFLPQGTDDYGKCDSIPEAEGLPGTCWCTPLYGEQKPWGCRWFTKWRENIEAAVESGAELEVYYFQGQVGKGKVKSFDTAGDDNLQREELNKKQKDFEQSPEFEQALDAGLSNLSKEQRGDGSSQYSREARRLFLASLSEAERQFLAATEGLGNSQKAEVAWLEKKGYAYWEVDVSTWLPGDGVERYVPAAAEQPQVLGRKDDASPISIPIATDALGGAGDLVSPL